MPNIPVSVDAMAAEILDLTRLYEEMDLPNRLSLAGQGILREIEVRAEVMHAHVALETLNLRKALGLAMGAIDGRDL